MAQEKEKAAIPGDVALDDTQPSYALPIRETERPLHDDRPPTEADLVDGDPSELKPADPEIDASAALADEAQEPEAAPRAALESSRQPDPTESPEPGNAEIVAAAAAASAGEATEPASETPEAPKAKVRRILPARPSTPPR